MKRNWKAQKREENLQYEREARLLGDPRKKPGSGPNIAAMGDRRRYVAVDPRFDPILTKRQKAPRPEGRNYYVKVSGLMGRLWEMGGETEMTMEEFVAKLDNESLVRGNIRNKDGTFGPPPQWVPRAFHRACVQELMKRGQRLYLDNYLRAIEAMVKIANGEVKTAKASDRLKAAMAVIERIEGKIPEKIHVSTDQPWQLVIEDIVAEVGEEDVVRGRLRLNESEGSSITIEGDYEVTTTDVMESVPAPTPPRRSAARRRRS